MWARGSCLTHIWLICGLLGAIIWGYIICILWRLYYIWGLYYTCIWASGCCMGASGGFMGQLYAISYSL